MYIKKSNQRLFFSNSRKNYNAQHCHLLHCFFFSRFKGIMEQRGYDASTWMCEKVPHPKTE